MDYTWMFYKHHENITALLDFFDTHISENPEALLIQIDGELMSNYVHEGNCQWGRSIVQSSALSGVGAGLEAVRAECVLAIRKREGVSENEKSLFSFPFIGFQRVQKKSLY
jgi:hypothetical protein